MLWPKFDEEKSRHLAITGAIRDEVLNIEEIARELLNLLIQDYRDLLFEWYKLPADYHGVCWETCNLIGRKRGMLLPGNQVDTERAAVMLVDEFRAGKIGRISLEKP